MKTLPALLLCAGLWLGPPAWAVRLLAIMPLSESFRQAVDGMKSDLGKDYEIRRFDVQSPDALESLLRTCASFAPQGLVLMDAKAITLARALQRRDSAFAKIPKFALMALKVEDAARDLGNIAGIRFEVPAYTIFTNLHAVSRKDFRKIGVFYRKSFSGVIEESSRFLAKEKMELVGECLDCIGDAVPSQRVMLKAMKRGMDEMRKKKVEVVWMLADNLIVNKSTLRGFWSTRFKEYRLPLVVPLENMVSPESNLGFFAAYPDHYQLGAQSAQQVIQVFESGRTAADVGFEPLISVQMTLNSDLARKAGWELNESELSRVKVVLGRD